ncbi:MAG: hypothetical protein KKA73_30855, partial [Chloroflexi bacterium]|nr:hypothetical protein [Chloroflexota bacterium]
ALADDLVAQAPAIAAQARLAGADPQAAFAHHVDALADQHGLTGRDLGDTWTRHVGELHHRLEES